MPTHFTKAQIIAFRKRWARVNEAEIAELQSISMEWKARQLAVLMASVKPLGWDRKFAREERATRGQWARLRKAYLAKRKKWPAERGKADRCAR